MRDRPLRSLLASGWESDIFIKTEGRSCMGVGRQQCLFEMLSTQGFVCVPPPPQVFTLHSHVRISPPTNSRQSLFKEKDHDHE